MRLLHSRVVLPKSLSFSTISMGLLRYCQRRSPSCMGLLVLAFIVALLGSEEEFVSLMISRSNEAGESELIGTHDPASEEEVVSFAISHWKGARESELVEPIGTPELRPEAVASSVKSIFDVYDIVPFQGVSAMCNGDIRLQSAFCYYDGECIVTGIANTKGDYKTNLIRKTVILDSKGERLEPVKGIHVGFVGDNHRSLRDAFVMKFRLKEEDARRVSGFNSTCYTKLYKQVGRIQCPIVLRKKEYKDYVAMLVTQYYSPVDIEWTEFFLKHYLSIGVDYIAVYTGFDEAKYDNYSQTLSKLITQHPKFKGRVVRYEWGAVSNIKTWSFSQTAMLNHGANVFMGSVVFHADLDEILYPVHGESIKSIAHRYNEMYGNWAFKFNSYKGDKSLVTGNFKSHKYDWFDFTKVYERSLRCHAAEWQAYACHAKYMYRSMSVDYLRIHMWSFTDATLVKSVWTGKVKAERKFIKGETTYCDGKWMNESDAVLLHLRGIQGFKGFSREYASDS